MSESNADIQMQAALDLSKPTEELHKFSGEVEHSGSKMQEGAGKGEGFLSTLTKFTGLEIATEGIHMLADGLVDAIKESDKMQTTEAQLNAVLLSTKGAAGITAEGANELADSFANTTRFTKQNVLATEDMLLTFTNIKSTLPDATGTVLNMAQALGEDSKNAAIQLGKALNDPEKGYTALQRVGVTFTQAQKDQIKAMQDAGDTAGAQGVILHELQTEFGGAAEAAGGTFAGKLDILGHHIEEVKEGVVSALMPGLMKAVDFISGPAINGLQMLGGVLSGAVSSGLSLVTPLVQTLWNIVQPFVAQAITFGQAFGQVASGAQRAEGPLGAILGPFGNVATALSNIHDNVVDVVSGFTAEPNGGLSGALSSLQANLPSFLSGLQQIGVGLLQGAAQWGMDLINWIGPMVPGLVSNLASFFGSMFTWITGTGIPTAVSTLLGLGQKFIDWIEPALPGMLAQLETWGTGLLNWILNTGIPQTFALLQNLGQKFVDWIGPNIGPMLQTLGTLGQSLWDWVTGTALPMIVSKLSEWGASFIAWVQPQIPPLLAKLGELANSLWTWITGTALPAIVSKLSQWGASFIAWVQPQIPPLLAKLGELANSLWTWITGTALPAIVTKLGEWGSAFWQWVGPQIPPLLQKAGELLGQLVVWAGTVALPAIEKQLNDWAHAAAQWVIDAGPGLLANLVGFLGKINDWVIGAEKTVQGWFMSIGQGIVDGIQQGISDGWNKFTSWLTSMINTIPEPIRKALGISSPSTVMIEMFTHVGEGMLIGLQRSTPAVLAHVQSVAAGVQAHVAQLSGALTGALAGATGGGLSGGSLAVQNALSVANTASVAGPTITLQAVLQLPDGTQIPLNARVASSVIRAQQKARTGR